MEEKRFLVPRGTLGRTEIWEGIGFKELGVLLTGGLLALGALVLPVHMGVRLVLATLFASIAIALTRPIIGGDTLFDMFRRYRRYTARRRRYLFRKGGAK